MARRDQIVIKADRDVAKLLTRRARQVGVSRPMFLRLFTARYSAKAARELRKDLATGRRVDK